jgi:sterol desaturase/sphingolipid hydroxylase (fatty acid hydroxylase superfamily)
MLDFIQSLNEWQFHAALIAVFCVLGLASRGAASVKWSKSKAISGVVNFAFLKLTFFYSGLFFFALPLLQGWYDGMGFPQVPREFWDGIPWPLTALALLFMYDFTLYWVHRLLHTSVLWPSHAVHHSDTDMHFLTWSRGHPTEQIVIASALVLSSTWMGLSIEAIAGLAIVRALHQYYVHANLDWDHGPLHYLLVSPRFHRWHHVDHPDAYDKNFASIFPFLDKMFGTYYNPHSAFDMPTGIGEHTPGHNIVALTVWPFMEWARMIGAKLKREPDPTVTPQPTES